MNKILLVARREFLTRVLKKTFLLTTILVPLIIFGFYAMIIYFAVDSDDNVRIAVVDDANLFNGKLPADSNNTIQFKLVAGSEKELLEKEDGGTYTGFLFIPRDFNLLSDKQVELKSSKTIDFNTQGKIQDNFDALLQEKKYVAYHISKGLLDSVQSTTRLHFATIKGSEQSDDNVTASVLLGYVSGFLIYIILFIYGTMVMRGVMEEKVSRIAEVIVSSVKPFQLMMGKILGIGAVGLVQFIIWIILTVSSRLLLVLIFPHLMDQFQTGNTETSGAAGIFQAMGQINFPLIIGCFIFYFLGGYLLYSSLFAAVGSAVNEDPQDAQSLMLPITMPIIFSIALLSKAISSPSSGLAVFGSLFPLSSPIIMMGRIARGVPDPVPYWQLATSMILLILGFLATTWLAAKIYRTGILMYGKKPTWKEMWKWAFRRG